MRLERRLPLAGCGDAMPLPPLLLPLPLLLLSPPLLLQPPLLLLLCRRRRRRCCRQPKCCNVPVSLPAPEPVILGVPLLKALLGPKYANLGVVAGISSFIFQLPHMLILFEVGKDRSRTGGICLFASLRSQGRTS